MPIFTIHLPPGHAVSEDATAMNALAEVLTARHVHIMGNCRRSEVTCIFVPNCTVLRGGVMDIHHLRIVGIVARGRTAATKQLFLQTVKDDLAQLLEPLNKQSTVALTLVEGDGRDTSRYAASLTGAEDRQWEQSIPN